MQIYNASILFSLFSLGFFGGFSHCSGMCGPFVLTQVSNRLQNTSLEKFSGFERLRSLTLLPYHFGRITTYTIIGFFCSLIAKNIKDLTHFNRISGILLLIAAMIFLQNLLQKRIFTLPFHLPKFKTPAILRELFRTPYGFKGYLLGMILGFIPCGLLYGAFALAASINNPLIAAFGMLIFGISTIPALFLTASGGYIFLKFFNTNFKFISKIIVVINIITLIFMGIGLILR